MKNSGIVLAGLIVLIPFSCKQSRTEQEPIVVLADDNRQSQIVDTTISRSKTKISIQLPIDCKLPEGVESYRSQDGFDYESYFDAWLNVNSIDSLGIHLELFSTCEHLPEGEYYQMVIYDLINRYKINLNNLGDYTRSYYQMEKDMH